MSTAPRWWRADWIPAAGVLIVVLLAGSRLITLSVQQHAVHARESAQVVAGRYGRAIESQLQELTRDAQRQSEANAPLTSMQEGRNGFWLARDGSLVKPATLDGATVHAIVSEWASADAHRGAPLSGLLGPIRHGSQWFVAARVPIAKASGSAARKRRGWSIAYQPLDALLMSAELGHLASDGYDFEVAQRDLATNRSRVLSSSDAARIAEPVMRTIRPPAGFPPSPGGAELTIAVRPKVGWYPLSLIVADIGLLALVTCLLTIGVYDMARTSGRLQAAVDAAKRHMQAINQRLVKEIEQRQNLQKSFQHARHHDAFTGLPNRRYFMVQLERALAEARTRRQRRIAIALIDIDRFKLINDTLGHTAGDEVMVQAARRFEPAIAAFEGVLARWGGDQFAVLLFDIHSGDTAIGAAKLLQESLREPFQLRKHRVSISASVGITCIDTGVQRAEDVLREADIALSVAKSKESARVLAYDPAMGGDVLGLVSLEADLHVALERDELRLLFQPIIDLRARRIAGVEALLRWRHPVEGLLTPKKFLAIAEDAGLIVPITRWTIECVCRLAGEWQQRLPPQTDFYISINLSATALRDPHFVAYVARILEQTHTSPSALRFELTESGLISNIGAASEILARLHGMGIQLMLDDFGTGYSSLNHLQVFPFDCVKIDRPFASRSGPGQVDNRVMCAMVQMVSSLGLSTIAEVVETEAGARVLQEAGCDFGQGNFFCEPVESGEALRRLRNQDFRVPLATPVQVGKPTENSGARAVISNAADASTQNPAPLEATVKSRVPDESKDDSPTLVIPMERRANAPNYDSPTIAEPIESFAVVVPEDDSSMLGETVKSRVPDESKDDSPTLAIPVEQWVDAPDLDSPTIAETIESFAVDVPTGNSAAPGETVEWNDPDEPAEPTAPNGSRSDSRTTGRFRRHRAG